jgi:hypothetical protein
MAIGIRTYIVRTSPENIIKANAGDTFYRKGDEMHLITPKGDIILDYTLDILLKDYKTPFYNNSIVELEFEEEIWEKIVGDGDSKGWAFVIGDTDAYVKLPDPMVTPTPTPTQTLVVTATPTPTITETPTPTPTETLTPTPTETPTLTPTPTGTETPTPTPTETLTPTPSITESPTPTPTTSVTPTETPTPTPTITPTITSTATPTPTPTLTPTQTTTNTPTPTITPTLSETPTPTPTITQTPTTSPLPDPYSLTYTYDSGTKYYTVHLTPLTATDMAVQYVAGTYTRLLVSQGGSPGVNSTLLVGQSTVVKYPELVSNNLGFISLDLSNVGHGPSNMLIPTADGAYFLTP